MANDKIYGNIIKSEPITKGWSEDKKYCVTIADGTKYLLRVTPISRYETRKSLFAVMEQAAALDIPMCKPVEFGICDDGVYSIQSWIDGEDLETVLPRLSEAEQYSLGVKSGEILRKIHTIPAPDNQEEWTVYYNRRTDDRINMYHDCKQKIGVEDNYIKYIEQNRALLKNRPQCFKHGDYHAGNMMLENGELIIIDFDRYSFGDPWEEFCKTIFSAQISPHFTTGQLNGYFNCSNLCDVETSHGLKPPLEFFKLMAFYISSTCVSSLQWAMKFDREEIDFTIKLNENILKWFDNMQSPVPTWYLKDFHV